MHRRRCSDSAREVSDNERTLKGGFTFFSFPSKKPLAILQKFGREVSMTSETFLTMARTAAHTSVAPACAARHRWIRDENNIPD